VTTTYPDTGEVPAVNPLADPGLRPAEVRALRRLAALDVPAPRATIPADAQPALVVADPVAVRRRPLGYQPALDGLRALSVVAVILYHAGFSWMPGGWIGVEVFFVVSGFLITSLLLDERRRDGRTSLGAFWVRRARRLLPALLMMLAAVGVFTLLLGDPSQRSEVRRDLPWALGYLGNWGQIVGDVPYYAADPPLLRHLWSLAIEEQFYLVWPLVFVALASTRLTRRAVSATLGALGIAAMVVMYLVHAGGAGPLGLFGGVDRVNFMYLSTFTRAGGLLLGAAAAFVWRPGRRARPAATPALDATGAAAVAGLAIIAATAHLTAGYVYQWLLALVSVLALVAVLVAVHPAATGVRRALGWGPLVAVGVRSYGLYLWHWPIFVVLGATSGSTGRVFVALALTVAVAELSYRYVEVPVRKGALGRWWATAGEQRGYAALAAGATVLAVGFGYAAVKPFDRAAGGDEVAFEAPAAIVADPAVTPSSVVAPAGPRRLVVVGDSQAHSLAINLPKGIESTFTVSDGSESGCSVYDTGRVRSTRQSFDNSFAMCAGWAQRWTESAADADAEIALVVLGAWDVFDLRTAQGSWLTFGSAAWDDYVRTRLQQGIDALAAAGTHVAVLEVPCMRPVSVEGAAVPPLPERADDSRVAHLNTLFRSVAAENPATTTFVDGPTEWCSDESVATDLAMRWDGVHVYKPGAKLIYETIAPELRTM
jgi:peptidoglycan/LPS O-acetylase OafA/YrhL